MHNMKLKPYSKTHVFLHRALTARPPLFQGPAELSLHVRDRLVCEEVPIRAAMTSWLTVTLTCVRISVVFSQIDISGGRR